MNAFEHHILGARGKQVCHPRARLGVGKVLPGPLAAEDDGRLGEVGREHVGGVGQIHHGAAELGCVGGIHLAAVGHHRVDKAQRLRMRLIQIANAVNMARRAQESAVHRVNFHANLVPRGQIVGQRVTHVVHVPARDSRVARKDTRGHGAHIAARRRQHRNSHTQAAFSVAAQIVDGGHTRDIVAFARIKNGRISCHNSSLDTSCSAGV